MKYKIIAIMGASGSGKDTILRDVVAACPQLHEIISFTTRPPRENEVNGVNYYFISGEQFGEKVLRNEMLEACCFNDWFYGTGFESLRSNCINIGVFNPTGVEFLLSHPEVEVITIYLRASDKTRLLRQLNREEDPDVEEILRRFKTDLNDFTDLSGIPHYYFDNEEPKDKDKIVKEIAALAVPNAWTRSYEYLFPVPGAAGQTK